jgi:hypothetical protein
MVLGYWQNRGLIGLPTVADVSSGDPLNHNLATTFGTHICGDGSVWYTILDSTCGQSGIFTITPGINTVLRQSGIKQTDGWTSNLKRIESYEPLAKEIDNGYPFILSMVGGGVAEDRSSRQPYQDHSVTVIGYDRVYSNNPVLIIHDTWDTNDHYIAYNNWQEASFHTVEPVNKYSITTIAGTGGSITPSDTVTVLPYFSQKFNIYPNFGYVVDDVKVDNDDKGAVDSYTFPPVTADHTILRHIQTTGSSRYCSPL